MKIARILEEKRKEFNIEIHKLRDDHSNILDQFKDKDKIFNEIFICR